MRSHAGTGSLEAGGGDQPLRILFVCIADFSAPGEKQVAWFAEELLRRGHAVMVSIGGDPDTVGAEGIDRLSSLRVRAHRFSGRRLRAEDIAAATDFRPDVIHAYNPRLPVVAAARCYRDTTRAPVFVHIDDDEWALLAALQDASPARRAARVGRRLAARVRHPPAWPWSTAESLSWVAREAAALDAIMPALAKLVEQRLGRSCSTLLPAGPVEDGEPEVEVELPAELEGREIVLYTGAVIDVHLPDFRLGVRAVAELQRRGQDVAFVHVGGVLPRLRVDRLAAEAGLAPGSAFFLGYRPVAELRALLQRASVLIQPGAPKDYNRYRLPSKLQRYLASGTPTVTFAAGFGELLEDRRDALKTYTADPGELADRIAEVLESPSLQRTLSEGGPAAARRLFDPARNTEALLEHYRSGLSGAARRAA